MRRQPPSDAFWGARYAIVLGSRSAISDGLRRVTCGFGGLGVRICALARGSRWSSGLTIRPFGEKRQRAGEVSDSLAQDAAYSLINSALDGVLTFSVSACWQTQPCAQAPERSGTSGYRSHHLRGAAAGCSDRPHHADHPEPRARAPTQGCTHPGSRPGKRCGTKSRVGHVAKIIEQLAPLLPGFPDYNVKDVQWVGGVVDMIVWDGLEDGRDVTVVLLDIKTGRASANARQRKVRDAVEAHRVQFRVVPFRPAQAVTVPELTAPSSMQSMNVTPKRHRPP
jgi:Holliday junction resolvase-like endonuclease